MSSQYPILKPQIRKYIEDATVEDVRVLCLDLLDLLREGIEKALEDVKDYNNKEDSTP